MVGSDKMKWRAGFFAAPALVLVVAFVAHRIDLPTCDVSWLITLAERFLAGERLSVDFVEVNPPGSVLLYVPSVLLGRMTGLRPETANVLVVMTLAVASLLLVGRILRRADLLPPGEGASGTFCAGMQDRRSVSAAGALALMLVLPTSVFGQREHVGAVLMVPWLALASVAWAGARIRSREAGIAGLFMGLAAVVKPHCIAPVLVVMPVLVWRLRSWRILVSRDVQVALGTVLVYGLALATMFQPYLRDTVPLTIDVYLPLRNTLASVLMTPALYLIVAACFSLFMMRNRAPAFGVDPVQPVLILASSAAFLAVLVQGKGWPYHTVPAVVYSALAVLHRAASTTPCPVSGRMPRRLALALSLLWFAGGCAWFEDVWVFDVNRLAARVTAAASRPRIALLGADVAVGFPLTRMVDGQWGMKVGSLWMAFGAYVLRDGAAPDRAAHLASILDASRAMFRDDLLRSHADVILVDQRTIDWLAWARRDPVLAEELAGYEPFDTLDRILILRRRSLVLTDLALAQTQSGTPAIRQAAISP